MADLLSTKDLAKRWGMTPQALQEWRKVNVGPAYIKLRKKARSFVRYRLSDVLSYEEKMTVKPKGETR